MPRLHDSPQRETRVPGRQDGLDVRVRDDVDRLVKEAVDAVEVPPVAPPPNCDLSVVTSYNSTTDELTVTVTDGNGDPVENATVSVV